MVVGVADWEMSLIVTWLSARDLVTYTLRELGRGLTAASSTGAVAAVNWAVGCGMAAFMVRSFKQKREGAAGSALPYDGMTRTGSEGLSHPAV